MESARTQDEDEEMETTAIVTGWLPDRAYRSSRVIGPPSAG